MGLLKKGTTYVITNVINLDRESFVQCHRGLQHDSLKHKQKETCWGERILGKTWSKWIFYYLARSEGDVIQLHANSF